MPHFPFRVCPQLAASAIDLGAEVGGQQWDHLPGTSHVLGTGGLTYFLSLSLHNPDVGIYLLL